MSVLFCVFICLESFLLFCFCFFFFSVVFCVRIKSNTSLWNLWRIFFLPIFQKTLSLAQLPLDTHCLPTNNSQPIFLQIEMENASPTVKWRRSKHSDCMHLHHHESLEKNFKNTCMTGTGTSIWISIKSRCAKESVE